MTGAKTPNWSRPKRAGFSSFTPSRRTGITRGNGTTTAYGYDDVSRLASLSHNVGGANYDLALGFAYNPASRITEATRSNDAYAFTGYPLGHIAYATNGLNQLLTVAGATATHDAKGNLTTEGGRTFAYSAENMLTSATIGGVTTSLSYDPLLRLQRIAKSGVETGFQYEGLDLIAEYDASGTMTRRYVHGPGTDEPLVWYVGAGTDQRNWLHADERGSIVAVTSVTGALVQANSYDEYGVSGANNIGRFRYTGQAWLPEIGIQYSKARMYDPGLGRFLQPDPIGYGDGPNLYAYVGGDPINFTDPLGLCTVTNNVNHCVTPVDGGPEIVVTATLTKDCGTFCTSGNGPVFFTNLGMGGGGGGGSGGGQPRTPAKEEETEADKEDCIPLDAGPVGLAGGGLDVAFGVGGGFGVYRFNIPSTGDSGWVATGSFLGGLGGSAGGLFGAVDRLGNLLGEGYRMGYDTPAPGVSSEVLFGSDGEVAGGGFGLSAGGGVYGGKTKTRVLSSTRPICKG